MPVTTSDVDRLREIKDQMLELLEEALVIVRQSGDKHQYNRAKAYWHPHIQMALTDDHSYMGSGGATLEDAIGALEGQVEDDDECEHPNAVLSDSEPPATWHCPDCGTNFIHESEGT